MEAVLATQKPTLACVVQPGGVQSTSMAIYGNDPTLRMAKGPSFASQEQPMVLGFPQCDSSSNLANVARQRPTKLSEDAAWMPE